MCTSRAMWWLCRGFGLGRCGLCICIRDGGMHVHHIGSESRIVGCLGGLAGLACLAGLAGLAGLDGLGGSVVLNTVPTDNSAWQKRTQITEENRRHRWQWLRMQFNLFQLQRNYYDRRHSAVAEQFTQNPWVFHSFVSPSFSPNTQLLYRFFRELLINKFMCEESKRSQRRFQLNRLVAPVAHSSW